MPVVALLRSDLVEGQLGQHKTLLRRRRRGPGDPAQWKNTCLACVRPRAGGWGLLVAFVSVQLSMSSIVAVISIFL